ncbi:MAG: EFR1 family ferrodoxin [Atopobiaceae bacterium]|jgi:ferredoxin|nr:EFR1 family ferrodoxin [Atopobiaceae bacterium]MCH4119876.1 EFR1 family ferrodoxin [Atopobiaceae bacterium]MCI1317714.1 EFR1 family ferrodoxin [Atopobiaceae bacterium]MCI1389157.1 EFR1 family ferrodoxin [Atopobiaceae bacterium]MCI1432832.1 EFR1 family ferrodoxin [Atopobiaceae bacterium]
MLLYFSATGNCKYVASRISQATGEEKFSIVDCLEQGRLSFRDKQIGIASPTYDWALPSFTREFLAKANLEAGYPYYVATYGTTPGASSAYAQKYLGGNFDAFYSVRMPDTWTPVFDLSTPEKVAAFSGSTEDEIDSVIRHLEAQDRGQFMRNRMPLPLVAVVYPFYERVRRTSNLHVGDACIGCGLCARKCPVHAIEMRDGRPVWVKGKCAMCLGCLHRCPNSRFSTETERGRALTVNTRTRM